MHPYRQLPLIPDGMDFLGFPNHNDIPDDVSSVIDYINLPIRKNRTNTYVSAVFVQGRNKFNANGQTARLGAKSFGFMWTAVACLLLACIMYCLGGSVGGKETGYSGREHRRRGFFSSQRSNSVRSNKEANP